MVARRADLGESEGDIKRNRTKWDRGKTGGEEKAGKWDGRRGLLGCVIACLGIWEKPQHLNHLRVVETQHSAALYG